MDLTITDPRTGHYIRIDLPSDKNYYQTLLQLELVDDRHSYDTLYIQVEASKKEADVSGEVIARLADRDAPFTRLRLR